MLSTISSKLVLMSVTTSSSVENAWDIIAIRGLNTHNCLLGLELGTSNREHESKRGGYS